MRQGGEREHRRKPDYSDSAGRASRVIIVSTFIFIPKKQPNEKANVSEDRHIQNRIF